MTLKCSHCGAPLQVAPEQAVVTCGYCHTATRVDSTRQRRRTEAPPRAASSGWMLGLVMAGVVGAAAIAMFVAQSKSREVAPPPDNTPQPESRLDVAEVRTEPATSVTPDASEPEATQDPEVAVAVEPARGTRPKPARDAAPTGPVSTKKEAEEVLRPVILACMKEHGAHYLITRLGNNPRGANVPPLGLTGTSIVDYKPTPGFATTPLGRCVARAASGVRAPAYGGNYIYFGLRNESIADPLADAPARLDTTAAKKAVSAFDDEARDCATRSPAGSSPGESVSVMVFFEGATGEVSKVDPYYIDIKSAYGRCLTSVYRKATVGKFREIEQKVVHTLAP